MSEPRLEPVEFLNSIKKKVLAKLPFADLGDVEVVATVGISPFSSGDSMKLRCPKYKWSVVIGYDKMTEHYTQGYADDLCEVWVSENIPSEYANCLKK